MNGKEVTFFNKNKPQTITVEKKPDCYQIGRLGYVNIRDYKKILGSKFSILLTNLRFQLGLDILRSFEERDESMEMIFEQILKTDSIKVHLDDLKILVKDEKFKKELNEIKENLERNFKEFSKYD